MAPGWRHLDLMAVAGRQLGFPVFTPGGRVSIPVAGGPGIAVQLEGLFSGRWLALTNRPIPEIEGEIQDPLTRDPVGRIYRVRYLAAP